MTEREPLNLEELLECLGSKEVPGDSEHRYRLRRALLKSRSFEVNRLTEKWLRYFSLTTSAVAGGAVAVALVLLVQTTMSLEVNNRIYAVEPGDHESSVIAAVTTSDLEPVNYLNQMRVADLDDMVPADGLRNMFSRSMNLAFTR